MPTAVQSSQPNIFSRAYESSSHVIATSFHTVANAARVVGHRIFEAYDFVYAKNPVTGNRELWFLPLSAERLMGSAFYDSMCFSNGQSITITDEAKKVNEVGQRLAGVAARKDKLAFEFRLLGSSQFNAWAMPNGKIAVYTGLLDAINNPPEVNNVDKVDEDFSDLTVDDRLAAVLSHEIVHSSARHSIKAFEKTILFHVVVFLVRLIAIPRFFMSEQNENNPRITQEERNRIKEQRNNLQRFVDYAFEQLSKLAFSLYQLSYSRSCEFEADRYGMLYMKEAGFNPKAALWLQKLFEANSPSPQNATVRRIVDLFRSHPSSIERLAANRATLADLNNNRFVE